MQPPSEVNRIHHSSISARKLISKRKAESTTVQSDHNPGFHMTDPPPAHKRETAFTYLISIVLGLLMGESIRSNST